MKREMGRGLVDKHNKAGLILLIFLSLAYIHSLFGK